MTDCVEAKALNKDFSSVALDATSPSSSGGNACRTMVQLWCRDVGCTASHSLSVTSMLLIPLSRTGACDTSVSLGCCSFQKPQCGTRKPGSGRMVREVGSFRGICVSMIGQLTSRKLSARTGHVVAEHWRSPQSHRAGPLFRIQAPAPTALRLVTTASTGRSPQDERVLLQVRGSADGGN